MVVLVDVEDVDVVEVDDRLDDDVVLDVLGKITAISIYMRKIDIESYGFSDSEKAEARARFFQAVSEGCAADENSLLAGVVDNAVKVALDL